MADGGEGTVDVRWSPAATGVGRLITCGTVTGALPDMRVEATFGMLGDGVTAVIEMAAASGLHRCGASSTTRWQRRLTGRGNCCWPRQRKGARIILGIGGATVDGGLGCAQACGVSILTCGTTNLWTSRMTPVTGRGMVDLVDHVADLRLLEGVEIVVASDVTNPLYGAEGACRQYSAHRKAPCLPMWTRWIAGCGSWRSGRVRSRPLNAPVPVPRVGWGSE